MTFNYATERQDRLELAEWLDASDIGQHLAQSPNRFMEIYCRSQFVGRNWPGRDKRGLVVDETRTRTIECGSEEALGPKGFPNKLKKAEHVLDNATLKEMLTKNF